MKFIILQLLSEKSKREAESRALSGEMETLKAKYEKKTETLNQGYTKLQGLLDKKEDQLKKQTESAQKASAAMKEELEQTVARHKVCACVFVCVPCIVCFFLCGGEDGCDMSDCVLDFWVDYKFMLIALHDFPCSQIAWQRTADAVDQFGKETKDAKDERERVVKEREKLLTKIGQLEVRTQTRGA